MTYSSPFLSLPGAVAATGTDAGVAAHYGDPFREQRALAAGSAVVDLSHHQVVRMTGTDRLKLLNTLSSQLLLGLEPGRGTELLMLSLQGRIEFDARVVDDGVSTWLLVDPPQAEGLAGWLMSMKFMMDVDAVDVSAQWATIGATVPVPELDDHLVWRDPWPHVEAGGYSYAAVAEADHPGLERPWYEYLVPASELEQALAGRSGSEQTLAGVWAAESLRIAAWRPRFGAETDEKTIPHELDLMRTAVHLEKGCYKGQETVARVHNLGHPPRRLVFLQMDGSQHTIPAVGSPVRQGDRNVGVLTSVAQHYEMGPIGLAVIKRRVDPTETLTVDDDDESYVAAQEPIVASDAGQVVGRRTGFLRPPR